VDFLEKKMAIWGGARFLLLIIYNDSSCGGGGRVNDGVGTTVRNDMNIVHYIYIHLQDDRVWALWDFSKQSQAYFIGELKKNT